MAVWEGGNIVFAFYSFQCMSVSGNTWSTFLSSKFMKNNQS